MTPQDAAPATPAATLSAVRAALVAQLGEKLGTQIADLARVGVGLTGAAPAEATGHCRFGGRPMLEPGTPWPMCEDMPLSLLAVIDTDALAPWLDGVIPPGTGLLNFFHLDSDSELADSGAVELSMELDINSPSACAVVPARTAIAVETIPAARSSVFEPVHWKAAPGIAFPDPWERLPHDIVLDDRADDISRLLPLNYVEGEVDWAAIPGVIVAEDLAFGWAVYPTGSGPFLSKGEDPTDYAHLLQLPGNDQWRIGGDGGWMHWSISHDALRAGDFTKAIPTPDIW